MERSKSKEVQGQLLKEVLAEFDIETQVNKIAVRCFTDLLNSYLLNHAETKIHLILLLKAKENLLISRLVYAKLKVLLKAYKRVSPVRSKSPITSIAA